MLALVASAAAAEAVTAVRVMELQRFADRDVLVPDPAMDRSRGAGAQVSEPLAGITLHLAAFLMIHGRLLGVKS